MTKTAITENWQENRDYELIPQDAGDESAWRIRILTGDHIESIIQYNQIKIDEANGILTFDFELVYSPDSSVTSEDPDLQQAVSHILHSLLMGLLDEH